MGSFSEKDLCFFSTIPLAESLLPFYNLDLFGHHSTAQPLPDEVSSSISASQLISLALVTISGWGLHVQFSSSTSLNLTFTQRNWV